MLQRLIAALLGLLGVASVGLGVASATAWRADDPLIATAAPGGDVRTLVTDPGVLELAGDPVTVTVRAEGSPVVLAIGRDTDVTGWVGSDPYARVTGLSDWHTLATTAGEAPASATPSATPEEQPAEPAPSPSASGPAEEAATAADPTGSDMWVVEATGDGTASLEWPAQDGRWSLIAVSLGGTAPQLDLSWPQTVTTPWLWPGVALGVLLLGVAAILLVRILRHRHDGDEGEWHSVATGTFATVTAPPGSLAATRAAAATLPGAPGTADGGAVPAAADGSTGGAVPAVVPLGTVTPTGAPLTRRQIREAEAAAAAQRKGRRPRTGAIPVVTGTIPVVTGATPAVTGTVPAVTGTTQPAPDAPPAPAGTIRDPSGSASSPSGAATSPSRTGRAPAGDSPSVPVTAPSDAPATSPGRSRGLAARMPWSRRADAPEPTDLGADAHPATPTGAGWTPAPGPATPGRVPAHPTVPAPPPAVPAGPASGTGAPEDEEASRAQRADAWRRMWGFPAEGEPPAAGTGPHDSSQRTDPQGTEEDR